MLTRVGGVGPATNSELVALGGIGHVLAFEGGGSLNDELTESRGNIADTVDDGIQDDVEFNVQDVGDRRDGGE